MIANLRAGTGESGILDYVRELSERGADVTLRFMREGSDLGSLLQDMHDYDRVVAAGGDGTISAVAYALRFSQIPFVPYPSGTANLFALNVRVPSDPIELAALTLDGTPVAIDIGELDYDGGIGFLVMAGAGFDANIIDGARDLKQVLGEGAYLLSAIQTPQPTVATFIMRLDGRRVMTEGIAVLLVNLARIQFDLSLTHGSDAQDGMLEVVVIKTRSVAGLLPAVWAALLDRLGEHSARPGLEIHTAREIEVIAEPPLPVQADGEVIERKTPLSARVLPGALLVVLPTGALPVDTILTPDVSP